MKKTFLIFSLLFFAFLNSACDEADTGVGFSYKKIINNSFRYGVGKQVPLTIEQPIETDGDISLDGRYFYYTSNRENGNYDIYIRNLTNIITVRITDHPSVDKSPAISPDGKRLLFVSNREDPEGDIYILKIDPKKLVRRAVESIEEFFTVDEKAKNLSKFWDKKSKKLLIVKDSYPVWSPDGKLIAFSSKRDNLENVWIMEDDGKKLRRLTKKGGRYPRFSSDGRDIIFVSYRDRKNKGEIYSINLKTKREKKLTNEDSIKLFPSYGKTKNEIIYTKFDRDTNRDKKIDLKDNSIIYYSNLSTKINYPLTLYSQSSFNAKWINTLKTQVSKGIIIYSHLTGNNININIIPETGIIPKSNKARYQYILANRYLNEFQNEEKYLLALENVYNFFNGNRDTESQIYITKSLADAVLKNKERGNKKKVNEIIGKLKTLTKQGNFYLKTIYKYLTKKISRKNGYLVLVDSISRAESNKNSKLFVPFLMEDLADEYVKMKKFDEAVKIYRKIIKSFNKYSRLISIHYKYSNIKETSLKNKISASILIVLKSGSLNQKIKIQKRILKIFKSEKNYNKRLKILKSLEKKYAGNKNIIPLIYLATGENYYQLNDFENAKKFLNLTIKNVRKNDITFYRTNILLGNIFRQEKKPGKAENYNYVAVMQYNLIWNEKNIWKNAKWLINYYEKIGERLESSGNFKKAIFLYKKYTYLMSFLNRRQKFADLYNEFAPRAHILYIDAYTKLYGEKRIDALEKEYTTKKFLNQARIEFNKAYIYGLGYIYANKGILFDRKELISDDEEDNSDIDGLLINFKKAIDQVEWAIFLDDKFIEPYLLKSWLYQYIDLKRKKNKGKFDRKISKYFPKFLWEKNIGILEKALAANDESKFRENEGNIHINTANSYFLLSNYPRALRHYKLASKFKKSFGTKIEEAIFYYHLGYCYWQNDELNLARKEISKALFIYNSLGKGINKNSSEQIYQLYKYFALFYRMEKKYNEAIVWYNKILNFASANNMKIDRARFLQEIAYCYKELGETTKAMSYLDNVDNLLATEKDEKKTYKIRWTLAFITVPFYDLGEDAVVIGKNKIFTNLNVRNKKLLNISLRNEILSDNKNYKQIIKYLKLKEKILKGSNKKVDQETMITTLNNLGYYNYKLRNYNEAKKYFIGTLDYASDEDVDNQEGIFNSIMNLSNLYAYLIENNSDVMNTPLKTIDGLISRINKYKNSYENKEFESGLKVLEKKAKSKKKKVSDKEKIDLKNEIEKKAKEIYYKIDIAVGVLKFYKADLLSKDTKIYDSSKLNSALDLYKNSKNIYELYSSSMDRFKASMEVSKKNKTHRLTVKLMQNIASNLTKLGDISEAYTIYQGAIKIAGIYRYNNLLINLNYKTGYLLSKYGKKLDNNYTGIAAGYFKKGIDIVEDLPFNYADKLSLIKDLYDKYAEILIKNGQWKKALFVTERKYDFIKLNLINQSSPDFHNGKDRLVYKKYLKKARKINLYLNDISDNLEKGIKPESEILIELNKNLLNNKKDLDKLIRKRDKSLFLSNLKISNSSLFNYKDYVIYKFFCPGNNIYVWKIEDGKINFRQLKIHNTKNKFDSIANFINRNNTKSRILVLNESLLNILQEKKNKIKFQFPFMFTPSISRVKYYLKSDNFIMNNIFHNGKGLKSQLQNYGFSIVEGELTGADYSGFSVIIDNAGNNSIEPADLFAKKLQPVVLIKNMKNYNINYYILFSEASLYSGIKTVIYTKQEDNKTVANIIKNSKEKGFDYLHRDFTGEYNIINSGYKGLPYKKITQNIDKLQENEYKLYNKNLYDGKFDEAKTHLKRWSSFRKDSSKRISYNLKLSHIEFLDENYSNSIKLLEQSEKLPGLTDKNKNELIISKTYANLYSGKIKEASDLINKHTKSGLNQYIDIKVFNTILSLTKNIDYNETIKTLHMLFNDKSRLKNYYNINRLKLLLAEYLLLLNSPGNIKIVLKDWNSNFPMSIREKLKTSYLNAKEAENIKLTDRLKNIIKIKNRQKNNNDITGNILTLIENRGQYNSTSSFVLLYSVYNFKKLNKLNDLLPLLDNININNLIKKSHWFEKINVLNKLSSFYFTNNSYKKALEFLNKSKALLEKSKISSEIKKLYYQKSIILSRLNRFKESYTVIKKGEKLLVKNNNQSIDYQFQLIDCEIKLGNFKNAGKRINLVKAEGNLTNRHMLILNLYRARIELYNLSKLKKASRKDARKFDELFVSTLNMIDRSPKILKKLKRTDLLNHVLDSYINYNMKTGYHKNALIFAEVKKHLTARIKLAELNNLKVPDNILNDFSRIKSQEDKKLLQALDKYPELQARKIFRKLPIDELKRKIPEDAVLLYTVRIGNDIFFWILGNKIQRIEILKKKYIQLYPVLKRYKTLISKFDNIFSVSRDLEKIFHPIIKYIKNKKSIILITDKDMEQVPFEIMGEQNMLVETHSIVYLSSLISGLKKLKSGRLKINLMEEKESSVHNYIEKIALNESGINYSISDVIESGFGHIHKKVTYDRIRKKLLINNKSYSKHFINPAFIYIPAVDYSGISSNDFSIYNSAKGVNGIVINNADVHDNNNAVFVDNFYKNLDTGSNIIDAFNNARNSVKDKKEYNHPAYWAGIRLYLNGL